MTQRQNLFALGIAGIFPIAALFIGLRNPEIFKAPLFIRESALPMILLCAVFGALAFRSIRRGSFAQDALGGVLFFSFMIGYFLLGSLYNTSNLNTNNFYFTADSGSWYLRMADESGWNTATRPVHPFAHLLFRPVIFVLSFINGGDRLYANVLLLSLAGAGCVFLTYKIVARPFNDEFYGLIAAVLLGFSSAHLVFSSIIETYIFSALLLLLFVWFTISEKPLYLQVITGLVAFGVTMTNAVQQALVPLLVQRNLKRTIQFGLAVLVLGIAINSLANLIYPVTGYFFLPSDMNRESRFVQEIKANRILRVTEDILLYNVVAPPPYFTTPDNKPRYVFMSDAFFKYPWFGIPAVVVWLATLAAAAFQFIKTAHVKSDLRDLSIALLLCVLFNFGLHSFYGSDPFLYAADWTYAVVLFVAFNIYSLAKTGIGKYAALAFLLLILVNNLWFMYYIAATTKPYLMN